HKRLTAPSTAPGSSSPPTTLRLSEAGRASPWGAGPIFAKAGSQLAAVLTEQRQEVRLGQQRHTFPLGLAQLGGPRLLADDQTGGLLRDRPGHLRSLRLQGV